MYAVDDIVYESSNGKFISLSHAPYFLQRENFFDWQVGYTTASHFGRQELTDITYEPREIPCTILVKPSTRNRYNSPYLYYEQLQDFFIDDIISKKEGKLRVNDWYLRCFIVMSDKKQWVDNGSYMLNDITIVAVDGFWRKDKKYEFLQEKSSELVSSNFLDFTFDYPYDYTHVKSGFLIGDPLWEADFKMTWEGISIAETNSVTIGGHRYELKYYFKAPQMIEIDSEKRTVYSNNGYGQTENLFKYRSDSSYLFEPIDTLKTREVTLENVKKLTLEVTVKWLEPMIFHRY